MKLACFTCGWNEALCDIHHILPKKQGGTNDHSNLTVICPNCHRIAHERKQTTGFKTIEEVVGDSWKEFYFAEGTSNPKVRKIISEGMKKAHAEGRAKRKLEV